MNGREFSGQMSFSIKPFALLMMMVMLIFLFVYLNNNEAKQAETERGLELMTAATNTLLLLANSEDCLAFQLPTTSSAYANIVDVGKLEEFSDVYKGIEPECARDYEHGYRVVVTETTLTDEGAVEGNSWSFGLENYSKDYYADKVVYTIPVALKYSESNVGLGKMELTLIAGELNEIAGFFDHACLLGQLGREDGIASAVLRTSYPITLENGQLCIGLKNKDCRTPMCELEFEGFESSGEYIVSVEFEPPNRLVVTS